MNIENPNQAKLPVKARISTGKLNARRKNPIVRGKLIVKGKTIIRQKPTLKKNLRTNKQIQGRLTQVKKTQRNLTRTIDGASGEIQIQNRNLITRGGKILRMKRNINVNREKKLNRGFARKFMQTPNFRNVGPDRLAPPNANPSGRKVEFDDRDDDDNDNDFERQPGQDDFMGKVNYSFEGIPNFPKAPLLPTPQMALLPTPVVEERIFPPVHNNFPPVHDNFPPVHDNFDHFRQDEVQKNNRNFEMQSAEEYEAKLLALERQRVEDMMYEEEQRRFDEEQRRVEEERKNLEQLRKTLDKEKRDLEMLKKKVEEEEEMERSMSIESVDSISNRTKQNYSNVSQNKKSKKNDPKTPSNRMPAAGIFNYSKQNQNENRARFDSKFGNNRPYAKNDSNSGSCRMPAAGLLDFMLNLNSPRGRGGYSGGGGRGQNSNTRGRGRGTNKSTIGGGGSGASSNTRGGGSSSSRGGNSSSKGRGGSKNNDFNQGSKFNETRKDNRPRDPLPLLRDPLPLLRDPLPLLRDPLPHPRDPLPHPRDPLPQSNRMGAASGLMDYFFGKKVKDVPGSSNWNDEFNNNQSNNFNLNDYDVASRGQNFNYSGGDKFSEYSNQRGSFIENERISNQNRGYDDRNEGGYQTLSTGFNQVKDNIIYDQRTYDQSLNQNSFTGHPYYDNFYDQGRINRNNSENLGTPGSFNNQKMWNVSDQNTFRFTGYPFRNRSPIYKGPEESQNNYTNSQRFAGYSNQSTIQAEKPTESFYSYRPGDKGTNETPKSGRSDNGGGIDILGGGTNLMGTQYGNSSSNSNFGENRASNFGNSAYYRQEGMASTSYSNSDAMNKTDQGGNSSDSLDKKLKKKKKNIQRDLKYIPPSQYEKRERLETRLAEVNEDISRLRGGWNR